MHIQDPWQPQRPYYHARRFRRSYIEMPKKNGKSTIASGIGLYMLAGDGEAGAEIWSLGADRDQALRLAAEVIELRLRHGYVAH